MRPELVALLALAALLAAPAAWSFETLGHATDGTFPAGGAAASAGPPGGGAMFGRDDALDAAVAYAGGHGGGAVVVASQSSAATAVRASGADVAGLGGFSGRESQVSTSWLAGRVADGTMRWVLADGGETGIPQDGRTGATAALAAVARTCAPVASVDGLYDCSGSAAALAAA